MIINGISTVRCGRECENNHESIRPIETEDNKHIFNGRNKHNYLSDSSFLRLAIY